MNEKLLGEVKKSLEAKSTDELLSIWKANETEEWSGEAFEAIRQILNERGEKPPARKQAQPPAQATAREPKAVQQVPKRPVAKRIGRVTAGIIVGAAAGIFAFRTFFEDGLFGDLLNYHLGSLRSGVVGHIHYQYHCLASYVAVLIAGESKGASWVAALGAAALMGTILGLS